MSTNPRKGVGPIILTLFLFVRFFFGLFAKIGRKKANPLKNSEGLRPISPCMGLNFKNSRFLSGSELCILRVKWLLSRKAVRISRVNCPKTVRDAAVWAGSSPSRVGHMTGHINLGLRMLVRSARQGKIKKNEISQNSKEGGKRKGGGIYHKLPTRLAASMFVSARGSLSD